MDTQQTPSATPPQPPPHRPKRENITGGLVLIAIGTLFLLNNLLPDFHFGDYWPVILIAVGAGLLWNSRK